MKGEEILDEVIAAAKPNKDLGAEFVQLAFILHIFM
jgi:hypothetical protein